MKINRAFIEEAKETGLTLALTPGISLTDPSPKGNYKSIGEMLQFACNSAGFIIYVTDSSGHLVKTLRPIN
jgi:hypothetical protein